MKPIERLGIAGVGLIGGSLALAAKRAGLAREVVGLGRSKENLRVALERGIVDRAGSEPEILAGAELVILATPVASLAATAAAVAPHLAAGAIVSDAGSVKGSVVASCSAALGDRARFVGAHPIAGTEASGAAAADPELFRGATCVVTPVAGTDPTALGRVRGLWEAVGMKVVEMSPTAHDEILALVSHAPHLLAFALALAAADSAPAGGPSPLELVGPSFLGATRVAASSPEMWRDILLANAAAVTRAIGRVEDKLGELKRALGAKDAVALTGAIERAREIRRLLEPSGAGGDRSGAPAGVYIAAPARGPLRGGTSLPGDKSIAHRALLFGGIAHGTTAIEGVGQGEDNASTLRALKALGVRIERDGAAVRVYGRGYGALAPPRDAIDCGNSGTTLRLLAGLLAARPFASRLEGDASLRKRPMGRVIEPLAAMGARIESEGGRPPLAIAGQRLRASSLTLQIASAQVKTALILAALQTEGTTRIEEPALSRDHTERLLPAFGVSIERPAPLVLAVRGPQELRAARVVVPGDPSAAAFWLVAASIVPGSRVVLRGVGVNPTRTGALDVLLAMGARIDMRPCAAVGEEPVADIEVEAAPLRGTIVAGELMLRAIDEFPVLAVAAACASGETRFADAAELRVKESDRLAAMGEGLSRLGVDVEESPDGMLIRGGAGFAGGEVDSRGDHRIAMAFAIAGLVARGPIAIRGADSVAISYPEFRETLECLERNAT